MKRLRIPFTILAVGTPARVAIVLVLVAFMAVPTDAQDLGQAAQKEKEKRVSKTKAAPAKPEKAKVFTDEDLAGYARERPEETTSPEQDPDRSSPTPAASPAPPSQGRVQDPLENFAERAAKQKSMRDRLRIAREAVAAADAAVARLYAELAQLGPGLPVGNRGWNDKDVRDHMKMKEKLDQDLARARRGAEQARKWLADAEKEASSLGLY